jgi:hypothetical protein
MRAQSDPQSKWPDRGMAFGSRPHLNNTDECSMWWLGYVVVFAVVVVVVVVVVKCAISLSK